jgi:hypothetical protein
MVHRKAERQERGKCLESARTDYRSERDVVNTLI